MFCKCDTQRQVLGHSPLQICPSDCRHTLRSLTGLAKSGNTADVCFYVYEDSPEGIARHALLLCMLFDSKRSIAKRTESFLELHSNLCISPDTAACLSTLSSPFLPPIKAQTAGSLCKQLEDAVLGTSATSNPVVNGILSALDFSQLTFSERDAIVDVLCSYRSNVL